MMTAMRRSAATLLLMATPLGLAACGSSESKPSKATVKAGMNTMLLKDVSDQRTKSKMRQVTSCVIDEAYPKLTTKALKAVAKGDEKSKSLTKADNTALDHAVSSCETKVK